MVLFREVYSWMRHLLKNDPEAQLAAIVIQEVTPMSASQFDTNDGARTLGIYSRANGLRCRIEVRFAGVRPTVVWVEENNESLVEQLGQTGFPGDWITCDVSSVCEFLLKLAKEKFCTARIVLVAPSEVRSASNFKLMDSGLVVKVLDALKANKNKKISRAALNNWLSQQDKGLTKGGDSFDFAHSVIEYFKKESLCKGPHGSRKLDWNDIDLLEDKFDPGHPIVEWSALKRWLSEPEVRGKLPPNILERVVSSSNRDKVSQERARKRMDGWLATYVQGKELTPPSEGSVALGQAIIAGFKSEAIPLTYLTQIELADPYEKLMPWSYIRRAVLSYSVTASAAAAGTDDLSGLILEWLESSDLMLPLYQGSEEDAEALKKALEAQVNHHTDMTLRNPAWVNKVLDGYVGLMPQAELVRCLQVDFDLWLFNALSPTVGEKDLPLSPYAFSSERRDQVLYEKMIGAWTKCLKDHQLAQQGSFIEWLTAQLESFYAHVKSLWGKSGVEDYAPHMPSVPRILEAVKTGDKCELLCLLVEDMEAEAGAGLPDSIRQELLMNPFFNSIYDAVRVQSVQLP